MFIASWKPPILAAPSPKLTKRHPPHRRLFWLAMASPLAIGRPLPHHAGRHPMIPVSGSVMCMVPPFCPCRCRSALPEGIRPTNFSIGMPLAVCSPCPRIGANDVIVARKRSHLRRRKPVPALRTQLIHHPRPCPPSAGARNFSSVRFTFIVRGVDVEQCVAVDFFRRFRPWGRTLFL